jgi:transcriptional regulator with XRE-family HTH domain
MQRELIESGQHRSAVLYDVNWHKGNTSTAATTANNSEEKMVVKRLNQTLADKLDHLFHQVHPGHRGPYSNDEVAAAISNGDPENSISGTYIWQLRKGKRTNPRFKHLEMLANFFGVPLAYFFDEHEAARINQELELLAAMRDGGVRQIAMRMHGLSPESLRPLADLIEQLRRLQGLADELTERSPNEH